MPADKAIQISQIKESSFNVYRRINYNGKAGTKLLTLHS
jgi:hypothetical protein